MLLRCGSTASSDSAGKSIIFVVTRFIAQSPNDGGGASAKSSGTKIENRNTIAIYSRWTRARALSLRTKAIAAHGIPQSNRYPFQFNR